MYGRSPFGLKSINLISYSIVKHIGRLNFAVNRRYSLKFMEHDLLKWFGHMLHHPDPPDVGIVLGIHSKLQIFKLMINKTN